MLKVKTHKYLKMNESINKMENDIYSWINVEVSKYRGTLKQEF